MRSSVAAAAIALLFAQYAGLSDAEHCNHQRKDYTQSFAPVAGTGVQVTPYFSPLHSLKVLTDVIDDAETSIDIMTPHWKSWISTDCDVEYGHGCSAADFHDKEEFPIWAAVLNANARGVRVRVLTNECFYTVANGKVSTYGYLSLAGIEVRQFASLSFVHAKFVAVDGKVFSISSINFSQSSFMENREAGLLIQSGTHDSQKSRDGGAKLLDFFSDVFESDWGTGLPWVVNETYSKSDLAIIRNKTELPVDVPKPSLVGCSYQDPVPKAFSAEEVVAATGPDHAHDFIMSGFNSSRKTLDVMVYEIGLHDAKNVFINLHQAGVQVRVLVSGNTLGSSSAAGNYKAMISAGIEVRTAASCFSFAHQKFWVVDEETAFVATGNLDYSDYPDDTGSFPVGSYAYRDFTVSIKGDAVGVFSDLFDAEWGNGKAWKPSL